MIQAQSHLIAVVPTHRRSHKGIRPRRIRAGVRERQGVEQRESRRIALGCRYGCEYSLALNPRRYGSLARYALTGTQTFVSAEEKRTVLPDRPPERSSELIAVVFRNR